MNRTIFETWGNRLDYPHTGYLPEIFSTDIVRNIPKFGYVTCFSQRRVVIGDRRVKIGHVLERCDIRGEDIGARTRQARRFDEVITN